MDEPVRVVTAEELDRLPLGERQQIAADSIVTDLAEVDPAFVDRIRRRGRELLAERGVDVRDSLGE